MGRGVAELTKHCRVASATATATLVAQQGRLYGARLVAGGAVGSLATATLYDTPVGGGEGLLLLPLSATPEDPDDWAPGLSVPFSGSLTVAITGTGTVAVFWERQ